MVPETEKAWQGVETQMSRRTPHPMAIGCKARIGRDEGREAYRSSEYDVLDAAITVVHHILPPILVYVRRIIQQSLSLDRVVDDLCTGFFPLFSFSSDPALFWLVPRSIRVLSVSPISLIYRLVVLIRIVNFKDVLLEKKKAEKGTLVSFSSPNFVKFRHTASCKRVGK